ncbi:trypsin-like serine protease [Nocardioides speluncae]|uniref:trypsin-like serine protease n=1 Tax=Nocardioides speluncae TaxID=2670337 RepID=UPI000D69D725|nr:trypsin-like serine protease [Nocardioides speluncae]
MPATIDDNRSRVRLLGVLLGFAVALGVLAPATADDDSQPAGPQIVGGSPAAQGEFPWVVHYDYHGEWTCGGAFIREDLILTAAHCLEGTGPDTDVVVEYGDVDLGEGPTVRSNYVYDAGDLGNDWGLIRLQRKIAGVKLLPMTPSTAYDGGLFKVMGWGATSEGGSGSDRLLKVNVPFVSDASCAEVYGTDLNPTTEICAGYDDGGKDSCQGDSGGPMVRKDASGAWVQVGIVSWGTGCARPDVPGIYAQVSHFRNLIHAKANALVGPCSRVDRTDASIRDHRTTTRQVRLNCTGRASARSKVGVNIKHPARGNLIVSLVAPDGSVYRLHNRTGGGTDNLVGTYVVDLSKEKRAGIWRLKIHDAVARNVGRLDAWSINLG